MEFKNIKIFFLLAIIFYVLPFLANSSKPDSLKIAIIGAGIGGASLSHYLSKNLTNIISEIKIFEKESEAGGRTNHFPILKDLNIEMGASFFIEANKNLIELGQIYNCSYSSGSELKETLGLWDGASFLFESSTISYVTMLKMLWRYKLSPLYFFKENSIMVEKFNKVYENFSIFHNYSEFLSLIKADNFIGLTMHEYLTKENYNKEFIEEFVGGVISGIYNQETKNINAFAGMIALAGANNKAFHFDEGNRDCVKKIIQNNEKVKLLTEASVNKISRNNTVYSITYKNKGGVVKIEDGFDFVIVATPIKNLEIETNDTTLKENRKKNYVKAFVSLIAAAKLNCEYFSKDQKVCPGIAMNVDLKTSFIADYSIKCRECYENKNKKYNVYKIQATKELNKTDLNSIFGDGDYKILDSKKWEAYPDIKPLKEDQFYKIEIEDGLFYLNGMENLASCMEMETISARNIGKLIWENLENREKEDQVKHQEGESSESEGEIINNKQEL